MQPMEGYYNAAPLQQPYLPFPDNGVNNYLTVPNEVINPAYYMGVGDVNSSMVFYGGMGYWG